MKIKHKKGKIISAITLSGLLAGELLFPMQVTAAGFVEDSTLTGGFYYWQRQRDRKNTDPQSENFNKYMTNLSHTTTNLSLDYASGYAWDTLGVDLGVFTAVELAESSESGHPNEIAFSQKNYAYSEDYSGDKSGVSLYKAAIKLQGGPFWVRAGYIQPSGQTLLAPHWSFMPGTYRGFETGAKFDYAQDGELSVSYMWTDKYKAPWHLEMDNFYQNGKVKHVAYLHSVGAKYDFKNNFIIEAAVGQAESYVNQYFAKASYQFDVAGNPLNSSYQFYGAEDRIHDQNDPNSIYDGLAWLQAVTLGYKTGPVDWRLEGTAVQAKGNQGYFLQRTTPTYASSNGRLDIWWNNRSDFNANNEKALFAGAMYDLTQWSLPGVSVGGSYVYAWDAKPSSNSTYDQTQRLRESAWSLDANYAIQDGKAKGVQFKLHYTQYDNHSSNPSWSGGYGNIFQDEKDVKFMVIAPFTVF